MDFDNTIICVKSERKFNMHNFWDLRSFLVTTIDDFERQECVFSDKFEMNITSLSDLGNISNKHYLKQPKQIIEWVLNKKLHKTHSLSKHLEIYPIL